MVFLLRLYQLMGKLKDNLGIGEGEGDSGVDEMWSNATLGILMKYATIS